MRSGQVMGGRQVMGSRASQRRFFPNGENFQLIQSSGDMVVLLGVFCEVRNHNHDYEGM